MNDHELDLALADMGARHIQVRVPTALREQVHAVPLQTPQPRFWLPQSPKWRFQSMFSALKFVVAGAIVALFGGFLLSGVMTQQPSQEPLPPAAASVSATTQAEPTDATTAEPEPTTGAEAEAATTTDLLPGVELELRDVGTGIYQVLSDGHHDLKQDVWDIAITPSGEAWVEKHRVVYGPRQHRDDRIRLDYRDSRVLRLGEPGAMRPFANGGRPARYHLDLDPQGDVHVSGGWTPIGRVWRDGAWEKPDLVAVNARGKRSHVYCEGLLVDSTCWWANWGGEGVRQIDTTDGSERLFTHADLGLDADAGFGFTFALGDDGTLWTSTSDVNPGGPDGMFTGLASYDGERWTTVEVDEPVPGEALRMAVAPDGTVWVVLRDLEDWSWLTVVQWDGATWETYGPVDDRAWSQGWPGNVDIHFAPDGRVWFAATTFYDGSDFRRVEIPTTVGDGELRVGAHAFGPDGSVWVVLIDMRDPESQGCEVQPDVCEGIAGLYVITPEAVQ